jgi:retinol dehydrogenase-12
MAIAGSLSGKTAVITGATAGIGLQAAIALAGSGALVIGAGRDPGRCAQAEKTLLDACPSAQALYLVADLSLQSQVRALAGAIRGALKERDIHCVDVLVNDAGTYSQKLTRTAEGVELTLAVNHLAPFLLTHELLPLLMVAPDARVITVSSASHRSTRMDVQRLNSPRIYNGLWAYKLSKLANVLFTAELDRRLAGTRVRAFAADPGLVNTAIAEKNEGSISKYVWKLRRKSGAPPEVPARTILFLSSDPSLQDATDIYWRDGRPIAPGPQALREDLARQLWDYSSQLCHIAEEWEISG